MAKASIHAEPHKTFSAEQANENQRCWTEEQYQNKNKQTGNHYDISRKGLNFEVRKGKDGEVILSSLDDADKLQQRYFNRLDELGFKAYKADARNNPNTCVDFVFGGDHDLMNKLAFGDQNVATDLSRDNSHIVRMRTIEEWAEDTFNFACKKWGEDNVIGMEVHLDETTAHAHILMIPVAKRKQRGRCKPGTERKEKEVVSFSGLFGDDKAQRKAYMEKLHTDYHEDVGKKYGLERGTPEDELSEAEKDARVHKNKHQLEAENRSKQRVKEHEERVEVLKEEESQLSRSKAVKEEGIATIKELGSKVRDKISGKDKREKQSLNDQIDSLTHRLNEESDMLSKEREKRKETESALKSTYKELKSVREDNARLQGYYDRTSPLLDELTNIKNNLVDVLPHAQSMGLGVNDAIILASGKELEISSVKSPITGEDINYDKINHPSLKGGVRIKWESKIKNILCRLPGLLVPRGDHKVWVSVKEWANKFHDWNNTHKQTQGPKMTLH